MRNIQLCQQPSSCQITIKVVTLKNRKLSMFLEKRELVQMNGPGEVSPEQFVK